MAACSAPCGEVTPRLDSLLSAAAARHPERPAVASGGREIRYATLRASVDRLAERMLRATGVRGGVTSGLRGARVAVIAPNVPVFVAAVFAASSLEAVAVPISARLREREIRQVLEDAAPTLIVAVPAYVGYSFADLLGRLLPQLPTVRAALLVGSSGEVERELTGRATAEAEPLAPSVAAILYTSGTTGAPKGALVTHSREIESAGELAAVLDIASGDDVVLAVPIAHAFGFTCLLTTIAGGACAALVSSTFSLRPLIDTVERRGSTIVHGSPSLFATLLKARPAGLASVRRGYVAGAPASADLLRRLDRAGMGILNLYGLTETGAVACCRPEDPPDVRRTTVGRLLPGFELRLDRADPGSPIGKLELRGRAIAGYYRRAADAGHAFTHDGWFRTGDLATIDDGYLRIAGRAKDLVTVGGFNVVPAEVEAALLDHPDVLRVAVIGVPHDQMGEALRAFVVARPGSGLTAAGLLAFARERIAGYKLPYSIRMLPELPLLSSGKPDVRALGRLRERPNST